MTALGKRIKELRQREGLTQEELARRVNVSTSLVHRVETGTTTDPYYSTFCVIARRLAVALVELLTDEPGEAGDAERGL